MFREREVNLLFCYIDLINYRFNKSIYFSMRQKAIVAIKCLTGYLSNGCGIVIKAQETNFNLTQYGLLLNRNDPEWYAKENQILNG